MQQDLIPVQQEDNLSVPDMLKELTAQEMDNIVLKIEYLSPVMQAYLDKATDRALEMVITDAASADAASENINNIAKCIDLVERRIKFLRSIPNSLAAAISEQGRKLTVLPSRALEEGKAQLKTFLDEQARLKQEAEEAARLKAEQQEAERRKQEAELRRKAEEAKIKAEADAREAERLKWEAEEAERRAAANLEGPRTESGFDAAAEGLAKSSAMDEEAERRALDAKEQAEEAQRLQEELDLLEEQNRVRAAQEAQQAKASAQTFSTSVKGAKTKPVFKLRSVYLEKLPMVYHEYKETLILKHLADGVSIPGVTYDKTEVLAPTKRR